MSARISFADHLTDGKINPNYVWVLIDDHELDDPLYDVSLDGSSSHQGKARYGIDGNSYGKYGLSAAGLRLFRLLLGYGFNEVWSDNPDARIRLNFSDFDLHQAKRFIRAAIEDVFGGCTEADPADPIS